MAQPTVYSFSNINMVINPPGLPSYSVNGKGVGEIAIAWANDNTTHDLAADGTVMISKVLADNGTIAITIQQTSLMHQYLMDVFNRLMANSAPAWAGMTISVSALSGGYENLVMTGVSFTKRADQPFQQQGQRVTWNFMAASISSKGSLTPAVPAQLNVSATIL